jgi:aspartyl-tRNA(Asn)/glutamyl-tRNA(Gln) amidotransferase subunit A
MDRRVRYGEVETPDPAAYDQSHTLAVPGAALTLETIAAYGQRLRRGIISAERTTRQFLDRIDQRNGKLGAYTIVAHEQALATARAIDALLGAGTDLGPLMGVPVAVKDLFYVDGMPPTAGSRLDVSDVVRAEGPFVRALKRAGCIVLGKTWTSEFALGGINFIQRVPWNPCDEKIHRTPGGSSGGSAVAMAAGLCAFAIGSDTGGSVRMPAALCGVWGHKFSSSAFPLDGIFPLSPTLDSIGTFTASAEDAILVWSTLAGSTSPPAAPLSGMHFARPNPLFYDDLDADVRERVERALTRLEGAGAEIVSVDVPEIDEFEQVFGRIVPIELIAILGQERVERNLEVFDPVVRSRVAPALAQKAIDYIGARLRLDELRKAVAKRMQACDAWITPTTPLLPGPLEDFSKLENALAWNRRALRNTRPGNVFDQCGVSIPLDRNGEALPVGLQISCGPTQDARLLAIARAVESALND